MSEASSSAVRLDKALLLRGLCPSRTQAQRLLEAGMVLVNGLVESQAKRLVSETDELTVLAPIRYVSRGGLKLEGALDAFSVSPIGRVCLDVGASTGGFTDCLLQRGAEHVLAVDVGTDQFTRSLLETGRVTLAEKTHVRDLPDSVDLMRALTKPISLVVIDVSFISVLKVLPPVLAFLAKQRTLLSEEASSTGPPYRATSSSESSVDIIALMKPQFEYGDMFPDKPFTDVVSDPRERTELLLALEPRLLACCRDHDLPWNVSGVADCVISGPAGNHERFIHLTQ